MKEQEEIIELENFIDRCDAVYYKDNGQVVDDATYDRKKKRLRELAPHSPSVTRVGPPYSDDEHRLTIKHDRVIGSLNDAMTPDEFVAWWPKKPCVASLKVDGLTLEVKYLRGRLVTAATRGNGTEGEDVKANASQAWGLPLRLTTNWSGNVRGEIYLPTAKLAEINAELAADEEEPFVNPRNAASGILRSDDGQFADRLQFLAHDVAPAQGEFDTQEEMFDFLAQNFATPMPMVVRTMESALAHHLSVGKMRKSLAYWIDGVVFTVNDNAAGRKMGVSNKRPKASIAFKFPAERATTTLTGVEWTVKHSGKLTPRGDLKPVQIAGTTVKSVSLFNIEEIRRLDIAIGDDVVLQKAGDIIPNVVGLSSPGQHREMIGVPGSCPVCGKTVGRVSTTGGKLSVDSYCLNDACPARVSGLIERYVRSLEIKGFGKELVNALCVSGGVKTPANLYRLSEADLTDFKVNGKRLGASKAKTLLAEINAKRELTVAQLLGSLGIKHLGKRRVQIMQANWEKNLDSLPDGYDAKPDELYDLNWWVNELARTASGATHSTSSASLLLECFGKATGAPGMIRAIAQGIDEKMGIIVNLTDTGGVRILFKKKDQTPASAKTEGPLTGRVFCLTGKFSKPKGDYHQAINALGGDHSDEFRSNVTDVVSADTGKLTGKLKKAKDAGINILDEDGLTALLGG